MASELSMEYRTELLQGLIQNKRTSVKQTIKFSNKNNEEEEDGINSSIIYSSDVSVEVGATTHTSGSSAVVTRNITNYPWEQQYFPGNMVAVHCSMDYIASSIKAPKTFTGMIRIIHRRSGIRGLVKNIQGMVRDLAFAHITERILLAFSDHLGVLYVYEVLPQQSQDSLKMELLMQVNSKEEKTLDHHRIIWCPYIPEDLQQEEDLEDPAYLLVATHGSVAEIWNVNMVIQNGKGIVDLDTLKSGRRIMEHHTAPITDAAFSPDGTALATAALDGLVKFFQVYMADDGEEPRCLHEWNPHDGKPLTSLFFLDNHRHPRPDVQFWKFAVTGACDNTELKVWSCESWKCHQKITFENKETSLPPSSVASPSKLTLKASMDPSSSYLLLSDIKRRAMFVLILYHDPATQNNDNKQRADSEESSDSSSSSSNNDDNKNKDASNIEEGPSSSAGASVVSITELAVQYPALSVAIMDAGWRPYKRWKHDHIHDNVHGIHDDVDDESNQADVVKGLVMRSVLINTKSLQEATISFQLNMDGLNTKSVPTNTLMELSASQDSIARDGLTDISLSMNTSVSELESTSIPETISEADLIPKATSSPGQLGPSPVQGASTLRAGVLSPHDYLSHQSNNLMPSQSSTSKLVSPSMKASQQSSMTLLTPDSFSSPHKAEEESNNSKQGPEGKLNADENEKTTDEINDLQNATLSLLLRVGSGTLMPNSESMNAMSNKQIDIKSILGSSSLLSSSCETADGVVSNSLLASAQSLPISKSPSKEKSLENILSTVISGTSRPSSRSSVVMPSSSLDIQDGSDTVDEPLATSEENCNGATRIASRGANSGTSSPSLEVQQILHTQNGKVESEYTDEDDINGVPLGVELAEEDGNVGDVGDLEDEPEALQTHHHQKQKSRDQTLQPLASKVMKTSSTSRPPVEKSDNGGISISKLLSTSSKGNEGATSTISPLLDVFSGVAGLPSTSQLTCAELEADIKHHIPSDNKSYDKEDSTNIKRLSNVKGLAQLTCEELEAKIKMGTLGSDTPPESAMLLPHDKQFAGANSPMKPSVGATNIPRNINDNVPPMHIDIFKNDITVISQKKKVTEETQKTSSHTPNKEVPPTVFMENGQSSSQIAVPPGPTNKELEQELKSFNKLLKEITKTNEERLKILSMEMKLSQAKVDGALEQCKLINKQMVELKTMQVQFQHQLPNIVSSNLHPTVEAVLRNEMRSLVKSVVIKSMDPIKNQVASDVHGLVTMSESHIADSLNKLLHSRSFVDTVAGAVSSILASSVQGASRDAYNKVVVPGFNAVSQQVFNQINESFSRGTKEYLQHVENESQSARSVAMENITKASRSLETVCNSLSTQTKSLHDTAQKITSQQDAFADSLSEKVKQVMRDEVSRALQDQHNSYDNRGNRAQTPVPPTHPVNPKLAQQQVQQSISQGQFNSAFKQALSASDLALVVFVCERVNPQQLFSQSPCPLTQDVLLSLVNQLSHDLATFTDLKIKYLEEAVINLDPAHPVTHEHMKKVLQGFQRKLNAYLSANPNHKKLRMLLMAVNHLAST